MQQAVTFKEPLYASAKFVRLQLPGAAPNPSGNTSIPDFPPMSDAVLGGLQELGECTVENEAISVLSAAISAEQNELNRLSRNGSPDNSAKRMRHQNVEGQTAPLSGSQSAVRDPPTGNNASEQRMERTAGAWKCPTCTLDNTDVASACNACGSARPIMVSSAGIDAGSTGGAASLPASRPSPGATGLEVTKWSCSFCTASNEAKNTRCYVCEGVRGAQQYTGLAAGSRRLGSDV